ncbi:MAG: ribosome biogenesis GTPase Der [Nitrospiraceae bacterium]|nr:ribosome biogenesis GTPase Der [Nitrospiraceae bacterium]
MSEPLVAIIGRPNVGKSTLFNRMVGGRRAIVEAVEGVTRDRNYAQARWEAKRFIVVDTGGFYPEPAEEIFSEVKEQALFAVDEADLIIHLLDARQGLLPADEAIAAMLRSSGKKVLWVVNKVDAPPREDLFYDFYRIGGGEVLPVSAATGYMFEELMEKVAELLPESAGPGTADRMPKVAVVGRPNVGKSTFINSLLGKKRLVVTPVAGTTRDSIDVVCSYYGRRYLFIDTAGIRRKSKNYPVEQFSMVMAYRSIERSDVAVILMDASKGIVSDDQKVAGLVHASGKGAVFVLNKWDLVSNPEEAYKDFMAEFARKIWFFNHAPLLTASGLELKRITKIFPLIDGVLAECAKTVPPEELDELLEQAGAGLRLPLYRGRKVRVYGIRQIGKEPPVFALYCSEPAGLTAQALKFFERLLRERFRFAGTPVKIVAKRKR